MDEQRYAPPIYPWRKLGTLLYRRLGRNQGWSYSEVVIVDCKNDMKRKYTVQSKRTVFDVKPGGRSTDHYTINYYTLLKDCISVPLKKVILI